MIQAAHVAPVAPVPVGPNKRPNRWGSTSAVVTIEELVASCHSTPYVSTKAGAAAAEHKKQLIMWTDKSAPDYVADSATWN